MLIKVLETKIAASCKMGITSKEYLAGETVEIFDKLAAIFIKEGWGVKFEEPKEVKKVIVEEKSIEEVSENKAIEKAPENKSLITKKSKRK